MPPDLFLIEKLFEQNHIKMVSNGNRKYSINILSYQAEEI